jgi:hypothetical protein
VRRRLVDLLSDARLVLAGPCAARALRFDLPGGSWPVEAHVPEPALVDVVERYELEPEPAGDLLLRSVPEPWPFPAQMRVMPELGGEQSLNLGLRAMWGDRLEILNSIRYARTFASGDDESHF